MRVLYSEVITPYLALDSHWQLVQRVAASQLFAKGPKLRAFLLYVCENSLQGKPENLTAQLIGTRVFGRNPDYVPSEDNIVRVEARELRKRLTAYFADEGRDEPIVIEIPKGSYSTVFLPREQIQAETPLRPDPHQTRRRLVPILAGALAVSVGIIVWQAVTSPARKQRETFLSALGQPAFSSSNFSIYNDLLGHLGTSPERDALLVLSNPRIISYQASNSSTGAADNPTDSILIPKELRSSFAPALKERDRDLPFQFFHINNDGYTGMGEAAAAFHLGRLMNLLGRRVHLTQGRFLNWDHVDKQDLILLGGPNSNDWSYEKDTKSNFGVVANWIANAKPLPGEQPIYRTDSSTDYALIQKLTTPYNFETLLIAGISNAGTAAAGEFLANPGKMKAVYGRIRAASRGKDFPHDWEILIKVAVRDGIPLDASVVASRP